MNYLQKLKSRKVIGILAGFLVLSALFVLFSSAESHNNQVTHKEEHVKTVKAFHIQDNSKFTEYSFPATVNPAKEIKVSFRVGGPVVRFNVETGQRVKKGDVIAKIDSRDFKVRIKNLKSTLDASLARLKDAELQYERYKSLLKENAASKSSFDKFEAQYKATESQTKAIKSSLLMAENALKDTKLTAPIDGYINRVFVENHETVAPGQPIVTLMDTSSTEIETFIPEHLIIDKEKFRNFTYNLTTNPSVTYKATLKEVGESATGAGHTYPLILKAESFNSIKPGMSAIVKFTADLERNDTFTIPLSAIISKNYKSASVWKIDTKNLSPVSVDIEVLKIAGMKKAFVKGNLKSGDWIVSAGANYIDKDTKISILPDFSETNVGGEL